jgi:hypothetical protein
VTAVARTLLDLAATVRATQLRKTIERAEELKLFELGPVESVLARNGGHHGAGRLRNALDLYRPAGITRSNLERQFLELVLKAKLPRPSTNFTELGFELDVYWPKHRFAVDSTLSRPTAPGRRSSATAFARRS